MEKEPLPQELAEAKGLLDLMFGDSVQQESGARPEYQPRMGGEHNYAFFASKNPQYEADPYYSDTVNQITKAYPMLSYDQIQTIVNIFFNCFDVALDIIDRSFGRSTSIMAGIQLMNTATEHIQFVSKLFERRDTIKMYEEDMRSRINATIEGRVFSFFGGGMDRATAVELSPLAGHKLVLRYIAYEAIRRMSNIINHSRGQASMVEILTDGFQCLRQNMADVLDMAYTKYNP